MAEVEAKLAELEKRLAALEGDDGAGAPRKAGSDAQIMKKVATRLQDFESQITAQLSNLQTDFDKKLSHVNRGASSTKPVDGAGGAAGLDTMAEDLDQLKYDVGELKDLLGNNKGEVNHIRRIVLACERDMEDFTAAMDAVNVDLDEMRARVDATHSIITSRQRVEATMTAEISTMRLDIGDIQEALKNHDSWMEDVSNTLQQMQEKEENLTEDIINLKNEMNTKLDTKVDNVAWKEANDDLDAAIKTVRDMVSSLRLDVDARRRKVDEILATVRHDITAVETNLEESKAKITSDTDQAVNALNGRIDFTNKDLAATQESLHTTQNSLSDCFNEVAVVRSDLERNVADTEARLKNDIRQKQQEAFEKIGAVEQQAELRSAEASRRLGALDLRMSGVQGGLGEHKRDILKLREEVNGLTVKSASHEVDIQKNSDATRKMEKQRNMDEQNWKAQMDAVHDVLDTKVNEKPFEDLKHCTAAVTRGVVKFAQVVGVFPGPKFDDAEGADQGEADVELLGWEECAENLSFRVDKAWRQRCSQRFRNILDMVAKKADHSVLRLLQISQQHIESQLERVKHERELWKEVVERRQQQPKTQTRPAHDAPTFRALSGVRSKGLNKVELLGDWMFTVIQDLLDESNPRVAQLQIDALPPREVAEGRFTSTSAHSLGRSAHSLGSLSTGAMAALALEGAITHALAVLALLILWLCWSWRRHAKDRSDSTKAELRQRELRQEVCQLQARVQHLEQELQDSQRRAVEAEAKWVAEKDLQRLKERTEVPQELERVHELPPVEQTVTEEVSLQALEKAKELMCQNLEMKARIQALEQELRWSTRPRSRGPPGADIKMNGTQVSECGAYGAGQTLDGCDGGSDGVTSPGEELQLDVDSEGSCSRASSIYSAYPRGRALKRSHSPDDGAMAFWWRSRSTEPREPGRYEWSKDATNLCHPRDDVNLHPSHLLIPLFSLRAVGV
ncbi:unnamed protein product [Durusdinium trenchii]|uniref:Uncharacterized protein n=2 Tax=Durusdinium trenchii TaxID=1381693 RepID=A0ABP0LYH9_9DINO